MPNIIITPNRPVGTGIPTISFVGASGSGIDLQVLQNGTVAFAGTAGQLFSISDSLTGVLMSVTDIAGLPILEVSDSDKVVMGSYGTNALVVSGSGAAFGTDFIYSNRVLFISGNTRYEGDIYSGNTNIVNLYYPRTNPSGYVTGLQLFATGAAAVAHANSIGQTISGNLTTTGQTLQGRITSLSGWTDNFFVHRQGTEAVSGNKRFIGPITVGANIDATPYMMVVTGGIFAVSYLTIEELAERMRIASNVPIRISADLGDNYIAMENDNQEIMRVTSSGVGIGTTDPASALTVNGNASFLSGTYDLKSLTVTANYTVLGRESRIYCNNTNPITLTFPTTVLTSGYVAKIKLLNTGMVTLTGSFGQNFDDSPSYVILGQYNSYEVHNANSQWYLW